MSQVRKILVAGNDRLVLNTHIWDDRRFSDVFIRHNPVSRDQAEKISRFLRETIEKMESAGLRKDVKIMIGGGTIDENIVNYVKADAYGESAMDAVSLADKWMEGVA